MKTTWLIIITLAGILLLPFLIPAQAEDVGLLQKIAALEEQVKAQQTTIQSLTQANTTLNTTVTDFIAQGTVKVSQMPAVSLTPQTLTVSLGLPPHFAVGAQISWNSGAFGVLPPSGGGTITAISGSWIKLRITSGQGVQAPQVNAGAEFWICVPTQQVVWN